ncbi:DUF72 domain-containing protein [Burkholderia territorii]|uniref:DUF72 domain-containing protein n=1 Tax=Burkholderia territorii TaxID=1503055 RepID=UPI00075EB101|nr:DUF72 domain-containing protein [Burkholderia territorii]KWE36644.1 hypothetical protein WT50_23795 [Burkholderia territorii]KWE38979.1 hypothetical protein WT49_07670 [Burkholderia territorii]KWE53986.1 hypothetical protein WT51_04955 [Burkholderia territorii]
MTSKPGDIHIGISGWRYDGWRGTFYPEGLKQAAELRYASARMQTIEINGTHYSLQSLASWRRWYDETPPGFTFSVKGARYLTHMLRFRDETATVACANFFAQGLLALRDKLGPILWQFPPSLRFDPDHIARFLGMLPHDTEAALALAKRHDARVRTPCLQIDRKRTLRHAIEVRHASFVDPAFVQLLRRHKVALVISDSTEPWPQFEDLSADFVYMRLHGTETKYSGEYSDAALDRWAARIDSWSRGAQPADAHLAAPALPPPRARTRDVYCYFDNDAKTHAPFDAQRLMERLGVQAREAVAG